MIIQNVFVNEIHVKNDEESDAVYTDKGTKWKRNRSMEEGRWRKYHEKEYQEGFSTWNHSGYALSLAACGGGTSGSTRTDGADKGAAPDSAAAGGGYSGKTLSIGIWGGNDQESAAINQVKADFEAKTGAKVEVKVYTDYNTQIQADFIAGTAPDAFYIDAIMFPFYSGLGVLEPLDPVEMGTDAYYENLLSAFTAEDGTVYCIPKDVSTLATYYNIGLLESVGVSPDDIPASLEDYKDFLVDLQGKLDEKYGKGQVAAMTYNQDLARNIYILEAGGYSVSDDNGNARLSSDGVVDNMQFMVDLALTGAWKTPTDLGLGWNGEASALARRRLWKKETGLYHSEK